MRQNGLLGPGRTLNESVLTPAGSVSSNQQSRAATKTFLKY